MSGELAAKNLTYEFGRLHLPDFLCGRSAEHASSLANLNDPVHWVVCCAVAVGQCHLPSLVMKGALAGDQI